MSSGHSLRLQSCGSFLRAVPTLPCPGPSTLIKNKMHPWAVPHIHSFIREVCLLL